MESCPFCVLQCVGVLTPCSGYQLQCVICEQIDLPNVAILRMLALVFAII